MMLPSKDAVQLKALEREACLRLQHEWHVISPASICLLQVTGEPVAAAALAAWTYLADYAHSLEASRDDTHTG